MNSVPMRQMLPSYLCSSGGDGSSQRLWCSKKFCPQSSLLFLLLHHCHHPACVDRSCRCQFNIPCCHFLDFITSKNLCFSTQSQPPITLDSKMPPLNRLQTSFPEHYLPSYLLSIPTLRILSPFKNWTSVVAQWKRSCLPMQEIWVQFLGQEDSLAKEMSTRFNFLARKILRTQLSN